MAEAEGGSEQDDVSFLRTVNRSKPSFITNILIIIIILSLKSINISNDFLLAIETKHRKIWCVYHVQQLVNVSC